VGKDMLQQLINPVSLLLFHILWSDVTIYEGAAEEIKLK